MISSLDFVGIPSQDAERSRAFYVETLGLRPDDNARFEVWVGETCFGIWEPKKFGMEFAPQKNAHPALHVDDVEAARAELEGKGVEFTRRHPRHRGLPHGLLHRPRRQRPDAAQPLRAAGVAASGPAARAGRPAPGARCRPPA